MLRRHILNKRAQKELLLMTHIVIGYPSFKESFRLVDTMANAGADLIELQIPGHDTRLDGKIISQANAQALDQGTTVEKSLSFAHTVIQRHRVPFLFVVYKNTLDSYGWLRFIYNAAKIGIQGIIIPNLPQASSLYYQAMAEAVGTTLIPIIFPASKQRELVRVKHYKGFCYCTTCDDVTGSEVRFNQHLKDHLQHITHTVPIPTATGFGIKEKTHVEFLRGCTDIAVIGTRLMQLYNDCGTEGVEHFMKELQHSDNKNLAANCSL